MKAPKTKPVLIKGGGDWTDASADIVEVASDLDISKAYEEYRMWYRNWDRRTEYLSFIDWLKKNRGAVDSTIEDFFEA